MTTFQHNLNKIKILNLVRVECPDCGLTVGMCNC